MKISDERLKKASEYFNNKLSFEDYLKEKALLSDYKVTMKGYSISCPFHSDSNPSLEVDVSRNIYKCFSCGSAGNLVTFMTNFDKKVLGGSSTYAVSLERLLKNDKEAQSYLGFRTIYEDSIDLDSLKRTGIKKLKLVKSEPKNFLELSNFIKQRNRFEDKINAIKLMQDGLDAQTIYRMLFGKDDPLPSVSNVFNFSGMKLEDLLRED